MRKTTIFAGIAALVGASYVAGTWYVGLQAERAIADAVSQANQRVVKMLGPDLNTTRFRIEIRDYQRGVFSSDAQYVIHTTDSAGRALEYVLQDHLQHGPFPLAALRSGRMVPMLAWSRADMVVTPQVREWFDPSQASTPLTAETQIGFGGQGMSRWTFAPIETAGSPHRVSFSGGYVQVDFTNGFNNNVAHGYFDAYALMDLNSGETIQARDIRLDSQTTTVSANHFEHHSTAHVSVLTFTGNDDAGPVVIDGLDVELSSTQDAELLDARLRYDAAHMLIGDDDLGRVTAAGALGRLNVAALAELQSSYAAMAALRGPDTEPGFELTAEEQRILQEKLRPILAAGPSLSLQPLHWENAAGSSQASATVVMQDPGDIGHDNVLVMLPQLVAQAELDLSVERSMVVELFQRVGAAGPGANPGQAGEFGGRLFDEYAQVLTQLGLTHLENGTLTLSLQAKPAQDLIVLNGDTMTTEQLMMLALGLMFL